MRTGEPCTVSDGLGRWRAVRFGDPLEVTGPIVTVPAPDPEVVVGFAPVKGDRPDWALQKLVELGVDRILLLAADRSVVRVRTDRRERAARQERIVRAAAMQSRRVRIPRVEATSVTSALEQDGVALAEPGAPPAGPEVRGILVGPEGGWSDAERSGRPTVGLADGVLRTETAAVAAAMVLAGVRSGWIRSGG